MKILQIIHLTLLIGFQEMLYHSTGKQHTNHLQQQDNVRVYYALKFH